MRWKVYGRRRSLASDLANAPGGMVASRTNGLYGPPSSVSLIVFLMQSWGHGTRRDLHRPTLNFQTLCTQTTLHMPSAAVFFDSMDNDGDYGSMLGSIDPKSVLVSFVDSDGDAACHVLLNSVDPQAILLEICRFIIFHRTGGLSRTAGSRMLPIKFIREFQSVDEIRFTGNRMAFAKTPAKSFIIAVTDGSGTISLFERYAAVDSPQPVLLNPERIVQSSDIEDSRYGNMAFVKDGKIGQSCFSEGDEPDTNCGPGLKCNMSDAHPECAGCISE